MAADCYHACTNVEPCDGEGKKCEKNIHFSVLVTVIFFESRKEGREKTPSCYCVP